VDIITQTETLYELVDERDFGVVREALNPGSSDSGMLQSSPSLSPGDVISFVCHMNTATRSFRYAPSSGKTGYERSRVSAAIVTVS